MSTSTEHLPGSNPPVERRFYARVAPSSAIYVTFGSNNLGVLQNVSENGFEVGTRKGLEINSVYRVSLPLNGAASAITVSVRTVWSDAAAKISGIQLLDLGDQDRTQIRQWVALESAQSEDVSRWLRPRDREMPVAESTPGEIPSTEFTADEDAASEDMATEDNSVEDAPFQAAVEAETPQMDESVLDEVSPNDEEEPLRERTIEDVVVNGLEGMEENGLGSAEPQPSHPEFFPMPLPIHREFVYEPPVDSKGNVLPRGRTHHSHRRTGARPLAVWVVLIAGVCVAGGVTLRYKISKNARHDAEQVAQENVPTNGPRTAPAAPNAAVVDPDASASSNQSATPPDKTMSGTGAVREGARSAGAAKRNASKDLDDDADQNADEPVDTGRRDSLNESSGARTNSGASRLDQQRETQGSQRTDRTYAANLAPSSRTGSTAERIDVAPSRPARPEVIPAMPPTVTSSAAVASSASPPLLAPSVRTITPPANSTNSNNSAASDAGSGSSVSASPLSANPAPAAASTPTSRKQAEGSSAVSNSSAARTTGANMPQPRRSAILGSILNSVRPGDGSPGSASFSGSNASSRGGWSPHANSYVASKSNATNPPNSPAIEMDTPQSRTVQIVAPRGFGASFVDLPGERVLGSGGITMHIQRSVRVPGERVPGQRWLWRGHLGVTVGELASRVDPAISQLPVPYGTMTVEAAIDKDGYVTDVQPVYGNYAFLPAVSRAIRAWHYQPTYLDNKPAETRARIEIDIHAPVVPARGNRP